MTTQTETNITICESKINNDTKQTQVIKRKISLKPFTSQLLALFESKHLIVIHVPNPLLTITWGGNKHSTLF